MLKTILALENVTTLSKQQQKEVNGGAVNCDPCKLLSGQTCHLRCPKLDHNS